MYVFIQLSPFSSHLIFTEKILNNFWDEKKLERKKITIFGKWGKVASIWSKKARSNISESQSTLHRALTSQWGRGVSADYMLGKVSATLLISIPYGGRKGGIFRFEQFWSKCWPSEKTRDCVQSDAAFCLFDVGSS